jgi:hypothetical protein
VTPDWAAQPCSQCGCSCWSQADATLPNGRAIARAHGRQERWGRLDKNAGLTGVFGSQTTHRSARPDSPDMTSPSFHVLSDVSNNAWPSSGFGCPGACHREFPHGLKRAKAVRTGRRASGPFGALQGYAAMSAAALVASRMMWTGVTIAVVGGKARRL